jgi:hypothetical protein
MIPSSRPAGRPAITTSAVTRDGTRRRLHRALQAPSGAVDVDVLRIDNRALQVPERRSAAFGLLAAFAG